MKTATFQNTVDILVKAYFDNTLVHGNCHACAVGNLVASNMGFVWGKEPDDSLCWEGQELHRAWKEDSGWANVFSTWGWGEREKSQSFNPEKYQGKAKEQIDATGYSLRELADIEYAFESAANGKSEEDYMFNGLMAVVDVLAEIHGIDLTEKETAKGLFVKA